MAAFFAGMMCGAIVSWLFFLFTYGTFQEEQVTLIESDVSTRGI